VVTPTRTEGVEKLYERAQAAASPEDRASCLRDIEVLLEKASSPLERGQLLLCRARVHANQWHTPEVLQNALDAMALFEECGEVALTLDATSLAAGFASRLGELSLAAELATKSILGLGSVHDDRLAAEVANRLGIFCYSFLDYQRAAQQFEISLAAAERAGDHFRTCRQLQNIADVLLLTVRANRARDVTVPASPRPEDCDRLERAGQVMQRLLADATPEEQLMLGCQRLEAELLLETGHPAEALEVIENAARGTLVAEDPQRAAFSVVESRCLRALGRDEEAIEAADRAVQLAQASWDDHELMLNLEERLATRQAIGDMKGAVVDALDAKWRMWAIHQRQTAQVVEQVWKRASLERERDQLEETTAAAVRSAEEDPLTGIGNRRLLERFLARSAATPVTLALVMVDIDHFKEINDTFGHELGDLVLRSLGELFASEARPGQVIVRYGGEEFVFAMPGAELAAAASFAERVRVRVVSHPWDELKAHLGVTISLGVSSGCSDAWRAVLAAADSALYLAKRSGRNRVEVVSPAAAQTAAEMTGHSGAPGWAPEAQPSLGPQIGRPPDKRLATTGEAREISGPVRAGEADAASTGTRTTTSLPPLSGSDLPYQRLVESMAEGVMVTTLGSTVLLVNPRMAALLRTTPERILGVRAASLVAEGSQDAFAQLIRAEKATVEPVELTFCAGGGNDVQASVTANRLDLEGETVICLLVTDITIQRAGADKLAAKERWFHTLVQNSSDVIGVVDPNAYLTYVNPAHEHMGLPPAGQGVNLLDFVHPDDLKRARAVFMKHASRPGTHPPGVYRLRTKSGGWRVLEVVATNYLDDPAIAGIVLNARDVTERINLTRALRTLGQGNQVLVRASDEASLLADMCRTIVDAGGYLMAWVGYAEHDEARTVRPAASAGCTEYLNDVPITWGDDERGRGPTSTAVRTSTVRVLRDISRSRKSAWRATAEKYGFRSSCALPLIVGDSTIGALSIYAGEPGAFDPAAVDLLRELADDLAYGIGRVRDAAALQASEERFRILADAAPIGILESTPGGGISYANPRASEICGVSVESLMGRGWAAAVHPDDVPETLAFAERIRPARAKMNVSFRIRRPDGEVRHVRFVAAPKGQDPDSGHVATLADVTEGVQAQEKLAYQAFYDALTGLPNRDLFLDRLNQELAQRRHDTPNIAVLFLDLDRFKVVNDSLGHEAGDAVLKEVGDRFLCAVRTGETVAHFGGDEFVFIIRDVHEAQDAVNAAKRLLRVLQSPLRLREQDLTVTGSMGIVVPGASADAATVVRDADTAMYRAKEAGRDRYQLFEEDLHHRSVRRLSIESDLRQALACQQFELYYQAKIELPSGRPMGAEALIRWHHPERGIVSPLEFIPVAEESGLIKPIGDWVVEQAVSQLASWDAQDDGPRLDVLSVNLSARQLDDPGTPAMVRDVLERYGTAPGRVALEVTESVVMADSASTKLSLASFRDLGVRVSIDDFGTGYSSLAYLHTLPVTTVKIDRSFIERLAEADGSAPVVQAIIEMAHAMGLRVIAEGVSSARLRALVSAMGCDVAQGFHWSRPLPAGKFAGWWQRVERRPISPSSRSARCPRSAGELDGLGDV